MAHGESSLPATERRNPNTFTLDQMDAKEVLQQMSAADEEAVLAVRQSLPQVESAVVAIADSMSAGGRLFYVGAGTSGRLGILDASECPPTFGVDPSLVQGIIAGGKAAITTPVENAEDNEEAGRLDLIHKITNKDTVIGLAASGTTPYVLGAVRYAKELGATTVGISCNLGTPLSEAVQFPIELSTGPEILTGSTRLKAGTAQKLVLNMISTSVMIRLGKVYENLMVDVQATNEKLKQRVQRIVMDATGVEFNEAASLVKEANGHAKTAIVMYKTGLSAASATTLLEQSRGVIQTALQQWKSP